MIRHIALLTLTADASETQRAALLAGLDTLPGAVDSIRTYSRGLDLGLAGTNATVAIVAEFDDIDGFTAYRDHPEHVRVIAELITPILAGRTAAQYDLGGR